ncbi:unnamed protein product [Auanema sp. JU1783]|nr:unnamed protein product [Auanema sp. JU1783]
MVLALVLSTKRIEFSAKWNISSHNQKREEFSVPIGISSMRSLTKEWTIVLRSTLPSFNDSGIKRTFGKTVESKSVLNCCNSHRQLRRDVLHDTFLQCSC